MTVIAAIYPPKGLPIFLCDTLISVPGQQTGRVAGPSGLIARPPDTTSYKVHALEQKNVVFKDTVFVAYAGSSFVAKNVFRRLEKGLANATAPTKEQVSAILSESLDDLERNDTAILAAVLSDAVCHHLSFGSGFEERTLQDGTTIYVNGSGTSALINLFTTIWTATTLKPHPPSLIRHPVRRLLYSVAKWRRGAHYDDVFQAFGLVAEVSSRESLMAEVDSHFGAIVELVRATSVGFEKLPSATIATELMTFQREEATLLSGNYLNYAYNADLLIYRRFGEIRNEEMRSVFGTDYIAGAINPPLRKVSTQEENEAIEKLMSRTTFNDSVVQCASWSNPDDLSQRKLSIGEPNLTDFRIQRNVDHFEIFRSHRFLSELAARFSVKKVIAQ